MAEQDKLSALGLDTEEGLTFCAGDPEFYEEMLREFVSEGEGRLAVLARAFAGEDWAAYGLAAHSVKSTSRMIGAKALSELARERELEAKAGDGERLRASHAAFLEAYGALLRALREVLG